ncbi:hypothetical protein OHA72_34950 [Dactylosporangium sp. NBC_01737]|uniref:hypothetical protein n=1 Tax=Dactylosporangium sp. NBC_01737 TaxID=2975959 RepID=UPI002E1096A4|nr:hypothetical protein OHA72_34950 [Dactylosporangium sp. NBC_01737]
MSSFDSFLEKIRHGLGDAGIAMSAGAFRTLFWTVIVLVVVITLFRTRHASRAFVGKQVRAKAWKDTGKAATFVSLLLFIIAYAFYSGNQTRTFVQATTDLVRDQLAQVTPLAIVTQFVLLTACWVVYGAIMRIPLAHLFLPFVMSLWMVFFAADVMLFTVSVAAGLRSDWLIAVLALAAVVPLVYVTIALRSMTRRASGDSGESGARSPWRVSVRDLAVETGAAILLSAFLAGGVLIYLLVRDHPGGPTLGLMLKGELVCGSVLFLLACITFRSKDNLAYWQVPPAIFYFVDLSLALSAGVIALGGLADAKVTLGGLPVWLIAAGPSLLVIVAVVLINILPERRDIARWRVCLAASVVVGLLAWPAKLYLTDALAPTIGLIF